MNQGQCQVWCISNFHIVEQLIFIPILQTRTLKSNNTSCVLLCGLHRWFRGRESACKAGDMGSIPESEDPLEEGMATHSSIPPGKIPWTEDLSQIIDFRQLYNLKQYKLFKLNLSCQNGTKLSKYWYHFKYTYKIINIYRFIFDLPTS